MRRGSYSEEYNNYIMTDEQQLQASDRFKQFCERATARNQEWGDFKGTDTYKIVKLLSPEVDDTKLKSARANYDRKTGGIDKDGVHYHTLIALKKLFISSLCCETPECDAGGMPASGDKFSTKFLNKRLDRKIDELKELLQETDEDHQEREVDILRTKVARLKLDNEEFIDQQKLLKDENRKLKDNVEFKQKIIDSRPSQGAYEKMKMELDHATKMLDLQKDS